MVQFRCLAKSSNGFISASKSETGQAKVGPGGCIGGPEFRGSVEQSLRLGGVATFKCPDSGIQRITPAGGGESQDTREPNDEE